MPPIIIDCQQNDETWFDVRRGTPTASQFFRIITPTGKPVSESVRLKYLDQLSGEAVSGRSEEQFVSYRMKQAKAMEDESCEVYAMNHEDLDVYSVGFVFKDERRMFGCSPDRMVGENGIFETKDAQFTVQIPRLREGKMVQEHIPQVQGEIFCCEREWGDFQSYCSGLPVLCIRNYRDEKYIKLLSEELERFCMDLAILIRKIRGG